MQNDVRLRRMKAGAEQSPAALLKGTSKYSACGEWREDFSSVQTKLRTRSASYAKEFCDE